MSDEIIFEEADGWGIVTLNAPQRLNALSHAMCRSLGERLVQWRADTAIRGVLLKAAGTGHSVPEGISGNCIARGWRGIRRGRCGSSPTST